MVFWQERHIKWRRVALAMVIEALMTMPGMRTSLVMWSA